jgi:PiT family inorganic phosphate transporter
MFELETSYAIILILCLVAVCAFEFVNGFHDTANAVATVIYTNTLKPWVAVMWSGTWNFLGVMLGGISVAMGIVNLLPVETLVDQNIAHSLAMIWALLLSAIFWNLLTWYLGIPCSSSHTLIGSILGVGLAYSLLPEASGAAVNWSKAQEIGISLLVSPLFGFSVTIVLMFLLRMFTKKTEMGDLLFKEPKKHQLPPWWIRGILFITCTLVSFFHGNNDGQKGVGLAMLVLIGIVPTYFALNTDIDASKIPASIANIEKVLTAVDSSVLSQSHQEKLAVSIAKNAHLKHLFDSIQTLNDIPKKEKFEVRKDVMLLSRNISTLLGNQDLRLSKNDRKALQKSIEEVKQLTDYSPTWVLLMISLSLGIGTMIGWKRIVKTIGEKIGKEHLNYAQGASSELVAASTIGVSSYLGLPVSTTHVLSSGIAGSMVASKGIKNLQPDTIRNILIAWLLTLPVVMLVAGGLFLLFRHIF